MKEFLKISLLLDYYGTLLTEKQNEILKMYYEEDYSLGEIADIYNISRQAAYDTIKKGEAVLNKYEQTLNLSQKQIQKEAVIKDIKDKLSKLTVNMDEKAIVINICDMLDNLCD